MSTFAVTNSGQILDSVNYLLSNIDTVGSTGNVTIPAGTLVANTTSGEITSYGNVTTGANAYTYINQYVNLRYANNASGSSGFSVNPTNANYFGVYNSNIATPSSNPAAYTWREVAGGFGTGNTIYYSAIGGRQVQFVAANAAPSSNFVISVANVAIDLDVVTTAAGLPGERGPIPMAYVITTNDPGTASSSTLSGWFSASRTANTPPIGTGLTPVTGDTAYFTYPTTGQSQNYTYNGSVWANSDGQVVSGATLVANTVTGNSLATATITGDKIGSGTITSINIGGGEVTGTNIAANTITATNIAASTITGNKIAADTITGNKIVANTITGDLIQASTITGNLIAGNTITGNLIAANTITGTNLVANTITAANVVSVNANIGNTSSTGYWLQASSGNARFGGNVSIGSNLTVSGLITTGNLIANTVNTTQVVPLAISSGLSNSTTTTQTFSTPSASTYYNINTTANIVPTINNQTVYVWAQADVTLDINNSLNNSFGGNVVARLIRTDSANTTTVISTQTAGYNVLGGISPYQPFPLIRNNFVWAGFTDTLANIILYTYSMQVSYTISGATVDDIYVNDRSVLLQTLKR